jgi:myotubularin-related protein 6/7/8
MMEYIRVAKACLRYIPFAPSHLLEDDAPPDFPPTNSEPLVLQVESVTILHHGHPTTGTLHLTPHHLIFRSDPEDPPPSQSKTPPRPREIWITYPIIATLYRCPASAAAPPHLRLRNRDFSFLTLQFKGEKECRDVFESIKALTIVKSLEQLYAFQYSPVSVERKFNGWKVYDPMKEYERMGIGTERCKAWRVSTINKDYTVGTSYAAYSPSERS